MFPFLRTRLPLFSLLPATCAACALCCVAFAANILPLVLLASLLFLTMRHVRHREYLAAICFGLVTFASLLVQWMPYRPMFVLWLIAFLMALTISVLAEDGMSRRVCAFYVLLSFPVTMLTGMSVSGLLGIRAFHLTNEATGLLLSFVPAVAFTGWINAEASYEIAQRRFAHHASLKPNFVKLIRPVSALDALRQQRSVK